MYYGKEIDGKVKLVDKTKLQEDRRPALRYASDEKLAAIGWYPYVLPAIDPAIEKYTGELFLSNNTYTRNVTTKTQEEQDNYAQNQIDQDDSSNATLNRKDDGEIAYNRIMAIIERRFRNGTYSGALAKGLMQYFDKNCAALYRGNWVAAQKNLNDDPITQNQQAIDFYNDVKGYVDNYVTDNF